MDLSQHTIIHCTITGETGWAVTEDGRVAFKGEPKDYSLKFFRSNDFIKTAQKVLGTKKIIINTHEDPAESPEMTAAFTAMEKREKEEREKAKQSEQPVQEQPVQEQPAQQGEPVQEEQVTAQEEEQIDLKPEHSAQDGDFCMVEVPVERSEHEEKLKRIWTEIEMIKRQKAVAVKEFKRQIDELTEAFAKEIKEGEFTHCKAQVRFDWDAGQKEFLDDKGRVIKRVAITEKDKQTELDLNESEAQPAETEQPEEAPPPEEVPPQVEEPGPEPEEVDSEENG